MGAVAAVAAAGAGIFLGNQIGHSVKDAKQGITYHADKVGNASGEVGRSIVGHGVEVGNKLAYSADQIANAVGELGNKLAYSADQFAIAVGEAARSISYSADQFAIAVGELGRSVVHFGDHIKASTQMLLDGLNFFLAFLAILFATGLSLCFDRNNDQIEISLLFCMISITLVAGPQIVYSLLHEDGSSGRKLISFVAAIVSLVSLGFFSHQYSTGKLYGSQLHEVVRTNDVGVARELVKRYGGYSSVINFEETKSFDTPLHAAARNGNLEIVKILLRGSAVDVNKVGSSGTALQVAVESGHNEIVKYLTSIKSVDVNKGDSFDGKTPFFVAVRKSNIELVNHFISLQDRIDLMKAPNAGELIGKKPCYATKNSTIQRLLAAAWAKKILRAFSPTADYSDIDEMFSQWCGFSSEILMWNDENGKNLLIRAVESNNTEIVRSILSRSYSEFVIDVTDREGNSPLHIAVNRDSLATVERLTSNKFTAINKKNNRGITPLCLAVIENRYDIVRHLLKQRRVDATILCNGETLLDLATTKSMSELLQSDSKVQEFVRDRTMIRDLLFVAAHSLFQRIPFHPVIKILGALWLFKEM